MFRIKLDKQRKKQKCHHKNELASKDLKRWRAKGKIRKTNNGIIEHISTVQNCNHTYVLVSCLCRFFPHLVFFNFPLILSLASHSFSHIFFCFFSAPFIFRCKYVFACFPFYILSAFYLFSLEFEERVIQRKLANAFYTYANAIFTVKPIKWEMRIQRREEWTEPTTTISTTTKIASHISNYRQKSPKKMKHFVPSYGRIDLEATR